MANGNNRVGVRDFLKSQGFRDEDIGWNNQSKTVTLQGRDFLKPPTIENNRAFADRTALQNALKQFRQSQTNQTTQTTQTPTYEDRINTFIEQLSQRVQAQPQPFSYDPQSDPSYQAALARARQNIQREQANTNAFLRARGQGRSSYSETVANQIAANAMSQLENEIVPALVQQAYQRYRDQIGDQQTQYANILDLTRTLSDLRQRDIENANQEWMNRFLYGQTIGVFPSGQKTLAMREFEYKQARDAIEDERYKKEFDEEVRRWGLEYALDKAYREGQLDISRYDAALRGQRFAAEQAQQAQAQAETEQFRQEMAQIASTLSQARDRQEALNWLNAHASEITRYWGPEGYQTALDYLNTFFPPEQPQGVNEIMNIAIMRAQQDPRWFTADEKARNALIQEYVRLLGGR